MENFNYATNVFKLKNCVHNSTANPTTELQSVEKCNLIYKRFKFLIITALRKAKEDLTQTNIDNNDYAEDINKFFILPVKSRMLHYAEGLISSVEILGNESNNQIAYNPTTKKFKANFCLDSFKQALFKEFENALKIKTTLNNDSSAIELYVKYNLKI